MMSIFMRHRRILLTTLAAAGLVMMPMTKSLIAADPNIPPPKADEARPIALPAGFQSKVIDAESGIKSGLVKMTERAVAKGDFNSLLAELAKQDQERAREFKGVDQAKLDGIVEQIRQAWKAKYGQELEVTDKNIVFDDHFAFSQGEVSDPVVAMGNWPAPVMADAAMTAASHSNAGDDKQQEKEAKLTKGRNVAVVRFPARFGVPEMTVSMIHQLPAFWRIDLPNDRSGEQIYNDLITHLTYINDHQQEWPGDVSDGYRMIAQHAAAALYGVAPTKGD